MPTADGGAPARFYALIDLAAAPELVALVDALATRGAAQCLFSGDLDPALRRVSPFIVDLARAPGLVERWHAGGGERPWGVLVETPLPLHLARRHVRRFTQVRLPDGSGPVLMRVWDPRVLGVLLDHLDAEQHRALFAQPVAWWLCAGAERLVRYDSVNRTEVGWPAAFALAQAA